MDGAAAESEPLAPPVRSSLMRSEDVLRALRGILVTAAIGSLGALVGGLYFDDGPAKVLGAAALLCLPGIGWLVWRGYAMRAALCLIGLFDALTLYAVIFGGGVQDPTSMLFPVMIIASGILLDRRLAMGVSLVLVASCIGVGVAELSGAIETHLTHELSVSDVVFQAILIVAVAALVALMSRALHDSIRRAVLTHESYREIFDGSGEGILVHEAGSGRVVEVNDAALAMFGHQTGDAFDLSTLATPETDGSPDAFVARLADAGRAPTRFEWCGTHRDGTPVWLDVTVRSAVVQGSERIVSVLRDTSERRHLQDQVQQAEKLRAVGQLARGVAHDFNNQLTVILANARLIAQEVASDPELAEYADAIVESSRRSADLTQQLLAFARKGQRRSEHVDIDALVADVVVLLARSIDKRIEVVHERSREPAITRGDASFLQNALLNLGLNARDAMPDGGRLRFVVEGPGPESDRIRVRVEDTGCGMTQEVQEHLFEPFYTTKETGNGMGLAAVYGTVVAHEGSIRVESELWRGSRFLIELPSADDEAPHSRGDAAEDRAASRFGGVHVLLAEDEPGVARVVGRILARLGCEVTHCEDGQAALDLLEHDDFDIALLDHSMPNKTGAAVLDALRERGQELPVIAMSGYSEAAEAPRHQPDAFLTKPFTDAELTSAFEGLLKPRGD